MTNFDDDDVLALAKDDPSAAKKPFVEPSISIPEDVLQATTYFLLATPGVGSATIT